MGFVMEEKLSGLPTILILLLKRITFVEFNKVGNTEDYVITPFDEFNIVGR